jgi:uncharacterized membrane protein
MIKMIIDNRKMLEITIEQEHKVHKEFKVHQEPMEHKVLQLLLTQNYVQQGLT